MPKELSEKKIAEGFVAVKAKCSNVFSHLNNALVSFSSKRFSLIFFSVFAFFCIWLSAFVGGYNIFTINREINIDCYQFYLCDFSVGFISRVIVGAVVSLFSDKISIAQMTSVAKYTVDIFFIMTSIFAGSVLRRAVRTGSLPLASLVSVFVLSPLFSQIHYMFFGTIDVYVLMLFFIIMASYGTKLFYFAAPVLTFVAMTVHYHYFFNFFPAVMVLLLYDLIEESNKKAAAAGFGLTAVSGAASFIYFVFFSSKFVKCTSDEFYDRMLSHFNVSIFRQKMLEETFDGQLLFRDYFDVYIFGSSGGIHKNDKVDHYLELVKILVNDNADLSVVLKYLAYAFVPFVLIFIIWCICIKKSNGVHKLTYIAGMAITAAMLPELYISTDAPRFICFVLTGQFVLLFSLYKRENGILHKVMSGKDAMGGKKSSVFACFCVVYTVVMLFIGRSLPM